jgi:hypothetical protein
MWRRLLPTKRCLFRLGCLLGAATGLLGASAAETAVALRGAAFDGQRCYRVRDLSLIREDVKLFLTDGYLMLAKPVAGAPLAAFFSAETEQGDGEVLLVPPTASERASLARYTQAPTLNEHFRGALLLFTDGAGAEIEAFLAERQPKAAPEMGALLAQQWTPVLRNLTASFETRLLEDLAGGAAREQGLFFAALAQTKLGNFDVIYDPQAREEVTVGHLTSRENQSFYDIWTSFPGRRTRQGRPKRSELDFTVQHVSIAASLGENLRLRATTKLRVVLPPVEQRKRPGALVALDISRRMRVSAARIDGQPVEVYQRESVRSALLRGSDNDSFLLSPAAPLGAGVHEIEVTHEGDVVNAAGNGVYAVSARGTWYPHHGVQFTTYDLAFDHARELTVIASGEPAGEREGAEAGRAVTAFRSAAPLRFVGFNVGEYRRTVGERAGLRVEIYANPAVETALAPRRQELLVAPPALGPPRGTGPRRPMEGVVAPLPGAPPSPAQAMERLAEEVGEASEFLAALLGPPPLRRLAVSPIPGTFGQGFPGLIYLSTLSYLDPRDRPAFANDPYQRIFFSDILVAHEVAHQWWGNQVASTGYQDEWLMEALANYSALMLLERRKGARAVDAVLEIFREHLLAKTAAGKTVEATGPIRLGLRLESSEAPGAWRTITYEKGTWILHMLRRRLGDAAWKQLLGRIAGEYRGRRLSTAAFLAEAARLLPGSDPDPKLENFSGTWIEGTGIPALRLTPGKVAGQGVVEQSGVEEEFSVDVPVEIQYRGGKTETRWVRTDGASTPYQWKLQGPAAKVTLDPLGSVLATKGR